jgi:hypothetical protein
MAPPSEDGKALPARPRNSDSKEYNNQLSVDDDQGTVATVRATTIASSETYRPNPQPQHISASQIPKRRESLLPSAIDDSVYHDSKSMSSHNIRQRSFSRSPMRSRVTETSTNLPPSMEHEYMPPPLSARRPLTPAEKNQPLDHDVRQPDIGELFIPSNTSPRHTRKRATTVESMSWLDMIDGSVGSSASSVHSRTSSLGVRRKHIRAASGDTEAEFDAALDAAVEAAYDDGFEPMEAPEEIPYVTDYDDDVVANVRRRVELAKERVRQTARETAAELARDRERAIQDPEEADAYHSLDDEYDGNESEEEERMLEEMTRGYVMDDFEFGLQSKSAIPRESDSSGYSGRTWISSIGSNPTAAGTSLSTVTEMLDLPEMPVLPSKTPAPLHPPPMQALPQPPKNGPAESSSASATQSKNSFTAQSVRSRRLSSQNLKQLKIETTGRTVPVAAAPTTLLPSIPVVPSQASSSMSMPPPFTMGVVSQSRQAQAADSNRPPIPPSVRQASSPFPGPSSSEIISPPTPTLTKTTTNDGENSMLPPRSGSPGRAQSRTGLRKNFSSSSLKNLKNRNLSVSLLDDGSDISPNTPLNGQFGGSSSTRDTAGRIPAMPTLPTPIAAAFRDKMNGIPTGGLHLFNNDINSPESPGSPGSVNNGAPMPLEPCPTEVLLRPFWLMRALYQTLAHSRGGYLSTKLFVPRDIWRVKGVKIKYLEDKISNCDYLTAALQKLSQVDTCDADAVLDEMQALEMVLEQVQANLTKKLGSEVGVQGSGILFKDAPVGGEGDSTASGSKPPVPVSKSSSFSWRRLRSKSSGVGLTNTYSNKSTPNVEGPKEGLTMSTLPMTSLNTIRFAKRDVNQAQFSGPNANYMGALARLFDAAQVIGNFATLRLRLTQADKKTDQIARQVDDPGLRHTDKTQVGLELCTRHAAEFFGFYICRFVLADIGLLLDKFIKRGSEWVLI